MPNQCPAANRRHALQFGSRGLRRRALVVERHERYYAGAGKPVEPITEMKPEGQSDQRSPTGSRRSNSPSAARASRPAHSQPMNNFG